MGNTYVSIVVGGVSAGALVCNPAVLPQTAKLDRQDIPGFAGSEHTTVFG